MPIYEYQCTACGHSLEAFQKMSDEALTDCPECHKPALQKLVSAAGFQLKGTGWYATDFKDKGKSDTKSKAATSSSDQGTTGTSDSSSGSSSSGTKD